MPPRKSAQKGRGDSRDSRSVADGINPAPEPARKYCRFKRSGIRYIDYKDPAFLLKLINDQGKITPRRLSGTSAKYQRKVAQAIKKARHIAILPYVADGLKHQ